MKAIFTKYLGPSNVRGSRCKAYDGDNNQVTLSWDCALNSEDMHRAAAYALKNKMGWKGELITGAHKDVYCHVFAPVKE